MDIIIDPKLTEYLKLRQDALKLRDPEAMFRLAGLIGAGSEPDAAKKIFELYKCGAARSHPESCYMVGAAMKQVQACVKITGGRLHDMKAPVT